MKTFLVTCLLSALALNAVAEPCARFAKWQAGDSATTTEADLPPAWVDPNLEGKTVKVYFRDGRLYEGKLVALTDDALRLKMGKRIQTIPLTEVARVERKPSRPWWPHAVALGMIGVSVVITLAALD